MENSKTKEASPSSQNLPLPSTPYLEQVKALKTVSNLADFLNISLQHLAYIAYHLDDEKKYSDFNIPKKSGGVRFISAPNVPIKILQKKIAKLFQGYFSETLKNNNINNNVIHGFMIEKSISTNASPHVNKKYLLNLDIKDFFPSIHFGRIYGYLVKNRKFELSDEVAKTIAAIACYKKTLPQGSPLSPILSNLIFQPCDISLLNFCKKHSITYTRYADDLTFSSNRFFNNEKIIKEIAECISRYDFKINGNKTRFQTFHERQSVTGITTNEKLNVSKKYYKKARSMVFSLIKDDDFNLDDERFSYSLHAKIRVLEGKLRHIDWLDFQEKSKNMLKDKTGSDYSDLLRKLNKRERTLRDFYIYKEFYFKNNSLLICEGPTDIKHIGLAIKTLKKNRRGFYRFEDGKSYKNFKFFRWNNDADRFLKVTGGTPSFKSISNRIETPEKFSKLYKDKITSKKIIYIMDYDKAGQGALKALISNHNLSPTDDPLVFKKNNIYALLITNIIDQEIEDLYSEEILSEKYKDKTFNRDDKTRKNSEFGKAVFSEKIIGNRKIQSSDFRGFIPFLNSLEKILLDLI